jgi:hypothetical protein
MGFLPRSFLTGRRIRAAAESVEVFIDQHGQPRARNQALAADDRQRYIAYAYVAYLLSQPAFTGYAWHLTGRGDVASGLWLRIRRAGPR